MRVSNPAPIASESPRHGNIFENPSWVRVFRYLMRSGLTAWEVEDLVRTYQEHRKQAGQGQMDFEDLKQGRLL